MGGGIALLNAAQSQTQGITGAYVWQDKDGNVVAAVSLIDNGDVYLGPGTEEERLLYANACAALLLQSNINE